MYTWVGGEVGEEIQITVRHIVIGPEAHFLKGLVTFQAKIQILKSKPVEK